MIAENVYAETHNDLVADYFAFRSAFNELARALGISTWQLEAACVWHQSRESHFAFMQSGVASSAIHKQKETRDGNPQTVPDEVMQEGDEVVAQTSLHARAQYNLARIGKKLGCNIWIAKNDRSKVVAGQRLGDLSIAELPHYLGIDPQAQKTIELIDVLWLKGSHSVVAAFEVEHSTSIYSGLLRMSDLVVLSPNTLIPLYIVTSETRMPDVRKQLKRPTFQTLDLHKRCGFFSYEVLDEEAENIMKWAGKPEVINNLANYVTE